MPQAAKEALDEDIKFRSNKIWQNEEIPHIIKQLAKMDTYKN